MDNYFVSVIVPNYNHAPFLRKRLDSILAQTYRNFELIILDDNSRDGSIEIINSYKSNPLVSSVQFNAINSGSPFRQWHKGIEAAKGDWIWIAESDDFSEPDFLQTLVDRVREDQGIVLAYCQSMEVDENSIVHRNLSYHTDRINKTRWDTDYSSEGVEEIRNCLFFRNTIPNASAAIFMRSVYFKVSHRYTGMKYCGDWLLWTEILRHGRLAFSSHPLNYFRFHKQSTRSGTSPEILRAKLGEQYIIIKGLQGIPPDRKRGRIREIYREFSATYKLKQFIGALLRRESYQQPIPFLQIVGHSILIRLIKLFPRNRASFF
jgi:glycosyltransferase involved in cell wall biosynthesis